MTDAYQINNEAELREVIPEPLPPRTTTTPNHYHPEPLPQRALKVSDSLNEHAREFIEKSPSAFGMTVRNLSASCQNDLGIEARAEVVAVSGFGVASAGQRCATQLPYLAFARG